MEVRDVKNDQDPRSLPTAHPASRPSAEPCERRSGVHGQYRCRSASSTQPSPCHDGADMLSLLERYLGQSVELVRMRMPSAVACIWLGFPGLDRLGYNSEWSMPSIKLTAHAIGHLSSGHCGEVRDGGQFACISAPDSLSDPERRRLLRLLRDVDGGASRLFSDREEDQAELFAYQLWREMGIAPHTPGAQECRVRLTCIG